MNTPIGSTKPTYRFVLEIRMPTQLVNNTETEVVYANSLEEALDKADTEYPLAISIIMRDQTENIEES